MFISTHKFMVESLFHNVIMLRGGLLERQLEREKLIRIEPSGMGLMRVKAIPEVSITLFQYVKT